MDRDNRTALRTSLPILKVIASRYSPRAFSDRPVSDRDLELILEAARWAPSSMNEQPWRFLVTRQAGEGYDAMIATLTGNNPRWAVRAPILMLVMAHRQLSRIGVANPHARHDVGLAVAQLTLQATHMGMGLHQLGGFDAGKARAAFAIPEDLDLVSIIALGWPGDPEELPEDLRERERVRSTRKPLSELVSYGRLG